MSIAFTRRATTQPSSERRWWRAPVAAMTTVALALGGAVALSAPASAAPANQVSGTVFRDFNGNGVLDSGDARSGKATDEGIAGVTVTATDGAGKIIDVVTSAGNGDYVVAADAVDLGEPLRLTFSGWPEQYQPSGTSSKNSTNGTSVQFVNVGDAEVNLALNAPEDFSQDNPPLVTAIQSAGAPDRALNGNVVDYPAIVSIPWSAQFSSGNGQGDGQYPNRQTLATFGEVGAVGSLAFANGDQDYIYAAATYKRHSGLGELGIGGIYRVPVTVDADGKATGEAVTPWLDVVNDLGVDVGTALTNAQRVVGKSSVPSRDPHAFEHAGKVGIGSLAVSSDGETLYFVNLYDRQLYAIDLSDPTAASTKLIPLGLEEGQRPWALTLHDGDVYVGYVDSGEDAIEGSTASDAGMRAYVIRADEDALLEGSAAWSQTLKSSETTGIDLGYAKGDPVANWGGGNASQFQPRAKNWNAWVDEWSWQGPSSGSVGFRVPSGNGWWAGDLQIYPQPILTGLTFDSNGYLHLGFMDRTDLQGGNRNIASHGTDTSIYYETVTSGDLLIAGSRADGTYVVESNGSVSTATSEPVKGFGPGNGQGPDGGEFYRDSQNLGSGPNHLENVLGSVATMPGVNQIVATAMDPLARARVGGLNWFTTTGANAGANAAGYTHTCSNDSCFNEDGGSSTFQKGGGLGAVALLAEQAPVEIGNRVWFDADQNGTQDADEPSIVGLTVELRDAEGKKVAETITAQDGTYYFRSDEDGFATSGDYTVVFVKPETGDVALAGPSADLFGKIDWEQVSFTQSAAGTNRAVDSNADEQGQAPVRIAGPGYNDHTIDAGFVADTSFTVQKLIDEAGGAPSDAQEFTIGVTARDFRGSELPLPQTQVTLEADEISPEFTVPVGSSVRVTEDSTGLKKVTITDPTDAAHEDYYRLGSTAGSTAFAFRVTNTLYAPGAFSVTKAVTGAFDFESPELADAEFTVGYTYAGGAGQLALNAENDWTATSPKIPYNTVVTLSEPTITGATPRVGFGTPAWSAGDKGDGTATVTIGDGGTQAITLTNPTTELVGSFAVTKSVIGDGAERVTAGTAFIVEYSLDDGDSWNELSVTAGEKVSGPASIPAGSEVLLREKTPPTLPDVEWGTPKFVGTAVTDNGDGTATLVITNGVTAAVTLENPTTPLNGQFSVTKDVTGPGASLVSDTAEFTVTYTSDAGEGTLTVGDGQTATSAALPVGTVVTVTEVAPAADLLPSGASWGTPKLTIDGGTPVANGATLTIGDDTVVAVVIENPTTVTPSVEIHKGDGDAEAGTIAHEADTVADGETYAPGETRDIVFTVQNTGPEPLRNVTLGDTALAGGVVEKLVFAFPDGSTAAADLDEVTGEWTATWAATFDPGTAVWSPGDTIVGTATLTLDSGDGAHQNRVTVNAVGALSGTPVSDQNDYNAFTGGIQVIKYDGDKSDPQVTDSSGASVIPGKPLADAAQDANTAEQAVLYPVDTARTVRWVVTNTGDTWLTSLDLADTTLAGPAINEGWTADLTPLGGPKDYSFVNDGPWEGLFAPGASFFAEGTLTLPAETQHADVVDVVATVVVPATGDDGQPTDQPATDADDNPVPATRDDGSAFVVTDDDPFHAETGVGPIVDIRKGDGTDGVIVNDADSLAEGEAYQPGETRTIVFEVTNTGDEALVDIVLTDATISGGTVKGLEWTLPDGTKLPAAFDESTGLWTASWPGQWQPSEMITGSATLTLGAAAEPHVDRASVSAKGKASGIPVSDQNDYNAFTGDIQVIKYDGNLPDPAVSDDAGWITPVKPMLDPAQDANDIDHSVEYPVGVDNRVRWVVTNTGGTWLTDISLTDVTDTGPQIGDDWTADLSAFGGPADYSFVESGPWSGLLPPGASFFAEGTLTLAAELRHADTVDVVGTVVVPAVGDDGVTPSGDPLMNGDQPVRASVPNPENPEERLPFTVDDDDPFHAWTGVGPYVDIEKGDGRGTEIAHDADTMLDGQLYTNGETRTTVFTVKNTGDEDLVDVVLRDQNLSGAQVESLVWTLPDGAKLAAERDGDTWSARWEDTFSGDAVWQPGEVITGTATLTLDGGEPHVDRATVDARGAASGIPVTDVDDYNAFTSGVQVIKYDGEKADPAVKDADGEWIVPVKPLVDAAQDANDRAHAVQYEAGKANSVRWVVTNTGSTWLTAIDLTDVTDEGPDVTRWTADLSAFGGPSAYDFVAEGTWHGLIPPGASFFAEGTLTLAADVRHADTVTVEVTPVIPAVDAEGVPTGDPALADDGTPVPVTADGKPVRLGDSDPFHAHAPGPLAVTGIAFTAGAWALAALLLMVLGALAVIGARRRRTV